MNNDDLRLIDTVRRRTGGQPEQNIVKCSWPSGKMHGMRG